MRGRKREVLSEDDEVLENIPYYEHGYEAQSNLWNQINMLPNDMQTIVKLRFFEELSLKEIASVTGRNLNTVKTKLYRALKSLKRDMEEMGV